MRSPPPRTYGYPLMPPGGLSFSAFLGMHPPDHISHLAHADAAGVPTSPRGYLCFTSVVQERAVRRLRQGDLHPTNNLRK
jgi:hypothetical protein